MRKAAPVMPATTMPAAADGDRRSARSGRSRVVSGTFGGTERVSASGIRHRHAKTVTML